MKDADTIMIKYKTTPTQYRGRNGAAKMSGLAVKFLPYSSILMFQPENSKGVLSDAAYLELPTDHLSELITALQAIEQQILVSKMKGEAA